MIRRIILVVIVLIAGVFAMKNDNYQVQTKDEKIIPQHVNYQGYLTNAVSNPITDPGLSMTFKIYDDEFAGIVQWTDTKTVSVENGIFKVVLAVSSDVFTSGAQRWLELVIGGEALTPRTEITAVGFSYKTIDADKLQGLAPSEFVKVGDGAGGDLNGDYPNPIIANNVITSDKIQDGQVQTLDIADNNVTLPKIDPSGSTAGQVITSNGSSTSPSWQGISTSPHSHSLTHTGDVTGAGTVSGTWGLTIANDAVNSAKIQDGSISGVDITKPCILQASSSSSILSVKNTGTGNGIAIDSAQYGVAIRTVGIDGVNIDRAARHGVCVDSAQYGLAIGKTALDGVNIYRASRHGVCIDSAQYGIAIGTVGIDGVNIVRAGRHGISIDSAQQNGVNIIATVIDGVRINRASRHGVCIDSTQQNGVNIIKTVIDGVNVYQAGRHGVYIDSASTNGIAISRAGSKGIYINRSGSDGIFINSSGDNGVRVDSATYSGVYIKNTGMYGVYVNHSNGDGLFVNSTADNGVRVDSAPHNGVHIKNTGMNGLYIDNARANGVDISYASNQGIFVEHAGDNGVRVLLSCWNGIQLDSTSYDGIHIDRAGVDGIRIENANDEGIRIYRAGYNGVEIDNAIHDALNIDCAGSSGVYVDSANQGIYVARANQQGVYAFGRNCGGQFRALGASAVGLYANAYNNLASDTAIYAYGKGVATGGWSTATKDGEAPCIVSPERTIIAYGTSTLNNGIADIKFDQIFSNNIKTGIPIRVNITPKGKPAGFVYVTETNSTGFKVGLEQVPALEKNATDISFDWMAIGTMKEPETTPQALAEWQKAIQEKQQKRAEDVERDRLRETKFENR